MLSKLWDFTSSSIKQCVQVEVAHLKQGLRCKRKNLIEIPRNTINFISSTHVVTLYKKLCVIVLIIFKLLSKCCEHSIII